MALIYDDAGAISRDGGKTWEVPVASIDGQNRWQVDTTYKPIYKPSTKIELPSDFSTVEELANSVIQSGQPAFQPGLASEWESKLEPAYAQTRTKLKKTQADILASLFPQGGGSGQVMEGQFGELQDLETDKLNRAIDFAKTDYAGKLAQFQDAQNKLLAIGDVKTNLGKFSTSADLDSYWKDKMLGVENKRIEEQRLIDDKMWEKQSELAKYLAEIAKPQKKSDWDNFLSTLTAGGAAKLGEIGITALLSSRDYKDNIEDNNENSLEIIKSLDIKNYQYKGDTKKRIGVIAEDTPELLTTNNKKALDIVNLFGVLLDAVKQLTIKIERMEAKNA